MISSTKRKYDWKQINYRSFDSLLAVEFLHDLYNRHHPYINSIRFRNTLLIAEGKEVTSYAPIEEWDFLAEWFGERFLRGDENVYREIEELINFQKPVLKSLLEKFERMDFTQVDDTELGLNLIDLHFITLGEIYKVNLVQIEHSLNYAINKQLSKYFKNDNEKNEAFAKLISADESTVAGKEEMEFLKIVEKGYKNKTTEVNENVKTEALDDVINHHKKYAFVHSAYGAMPYELNEYIQKYNNSINEGLDKILEKIILLENSSKNIKQEKEKYKEIVKNDNLLLKNIDIFTRIGVLRDKNKALMGTTTKWRGIILDEVSKRKNIDRETINYYFLREICNLLKHDIVLSKEVIAERKIGFGVMRLEGLSLNLQDAKNYILQNDLKSNLKGTCASTGECTGIVKIIRSSKDVYKMNDGDIMVAPGTDFDVINAMQKAGAIITEEGGVLSHASVVSRELGIPCIIGVKNATYILEEGKKVYINANEGEIKIIG